ncbi:hypothetical protein PR002_g30638 [Phytophthora rubi]|uniref:Uncharacterized protein n=1 Tax=Phytophthora rubi TaxID=129364 RepID=A0A6A3GQY0_9STRA|nr:hypothetical protein PR002_g30638 [Phytophthora rubi]
MLAVDIELMPISGETIAGDAVAHTDECCRHVQLRRQHHAAELYQPDQPMVTR